MILSLNNIVAWRKEFNRLYCVEVDMGEQYQISEYFDDDKDLFLTHEGDTVESAVREHVSEDYSYSL